MELTSLESENYSLISKVVDESNQFTIRFREILVAFLLNYNSKTTTATYATSVRLFLDFLSPLLSHPSELERKHLILYKKHMQDKGYSVNTVLKHMSVVSSLCKFLAYEGIVMNDLSYGINRPKPKNKREQAAFTEKEVALIFDSMDKNSYSYLFHRAILTMGFNTGLRSSELRNLKFKNVSKVQSHYLVTTVVKGGANHEIPLNKAVVSALSSHVRNMKKLGFSCLTEDYLFPRLKLKENKPISAKSLNNLLQKYINKAGINKQHNKRYSAHSMRATLASCMLTSLGVPLQDVQSVLGHSSPSTTQRYNKFKKSYDQNPVYKVHFL